MEPLALSGHYRIIAGILLGIIFGFTLVKSKIAWQKTMVDQIFFNNISFMKIFLISVSVGSVIFFYAQKVGIVQPHFRPMFFWGVVAGGLFTAVGLAICGHIPATAVAGIAGGRIYAIWIFLGMLLAMPVVKIVSGFLSETVYRWNAPFQCPETLDQLFSRSVFVWIPVITVFLALFLDFITPDSNKK